MYPGQRWFSGSSVRTEELPDMESFFQDASVRIDYLNSFNQDPACRIAPESKVPALFPAYITRYRSLNINLFLNGQGQYRLSVIEKEEAITDADHYLITVLAHQAEYILHRMYSESSSRSTTLQSIFQSVLLGPDRRLYEHQPFTEQRGWLPHHSYLCSVIQTSGDVHASLNADTVCSFIGTKFSASCSVVL